ncbi:glycoside hydrolase family 55 protein [Saccharata proteae CBS 121410]|uniref:Glycoside hydrolase family 55 protein n=1 Tax=Saccharata proteae CBS 121410 TaxID=1314787 RepID=A0A9P4HT57_9PEZI|nr:glycoside hydrolase family 55 protein [Saccharata proteae CBS 121410]
MVACAPYWLETMKHQGVSAFNGDASYKVFRNVKDYGAKGDGITDDTAAINRAISDGNRCGPANCQSSTTTPAVVYFPAGTYLISTSIIDYYYTQLIGNPNCLPTLKATSGFSGFGLIDGDKYQPSGNLGFGSTNVFYRQIRNFIIDMTSIPATAAATGIHWPTAQASSLQNLVFKMSSNSGTQHQGIFIESGSAGMMNDLVFYGGLYGAAFGNQQFTMRNLTFYDAVTAIDQIWDWGWTYKNIQIHNCSVGLSMNSGGRTTQNVGSVTLIDSSITNTPVGIVTAHDNSSSPATAGGLILENVQINNVMNIVQGPDGVKLAGTHGTMTVAAWGEGHTYTGTSGPVNFEGPIKANARPSSLLTGAKFYERSKPQYTNLDSSQVYSARQFGAKGDGRTDDTMALQTAINSAACNKRLLFVDAGTYRVTNTIYLPPGLKMTGETYPVIMSSGAVFADMNKPAPVVQVGKPGTTGSIEWSDMIVSTQGAQAGAVLIQWNLASPTNAPSGMWDVHTRIGGFAGSNLQASQCPTTPNTTVTSANLNRNCIAAYMSMHITKSASGLYMENNWLWVADHDIESPSLTQITLYAGRGLLIESAAGNNWLVGTAVEHHTLYQYQLANTKNIFMGQIQTETPYYQPNPSAAIPFPANKTLNDPVFSPENPLNGPLQDSWGLRIVNSTNVLVYGAGLYSFFDNYSTNCSNAPGGQCQSRILSLEGTPSTLNASIYNLNTVGTRNLLSKNGEAFAYYKNNLNVYTDSVALYRTP